MSVQAYAGHHSYECSLARAVRKIFLAYNWGVIEKTSVNATITVSLPRLQSLFQPLSKRRPLFLCILWRLPKTERLAAIYTLPLGTRM
jgi:hypothetical protein